MRPKGFRQLRYLESAPWRRPVLRRHRYGHTPGPVAPASFQSHRILVFASGERSVHVRAVLLDVFSIAVRRYLFECAFAAARSHVSLGARFLWTSSWSKKIGRAHV